MKRPTILAAALLLAAVAPTASRSATVAAEYCTQDACGNATLGNAGGNASGWLNTMQAAGHTRRYLYGNADFWPDDMIDCTVSGGKDCLYGDTSNIVFLESHGGSDAARFRITTGATHTIDGVSTCRSWTNNPSTSNEWWVLGNGSLRILSMVSCHSLELSDLAHWDRVQDGLHIITGGDGDLYDVSGRGANYAYWGNLNLFGLRFSVKQAWFISHYWGNETAVTMAYGVNSSDAVNRRDNERFDWPMGPLGTATYRAWSWVH